MKSLLDVLGLVSGVGFLVGGGIFLFLWHRDRKHPDQKKLGFAGVTIGALPLLARFMGWS